MQKIGWSNLKVFPRTTKPEELRFTWKLCNIAQNEVWEGPTSDMPVV
jgi:hypothetical protein